MNTGLLSYSTRAAFKYVLTYLLLLSENIVIKCWSAFMVSDFKTKINGTVLYVKKFKHWLLNAQSHPQH